MNKNHDGLVLVGVALGLIDIELEVKDVTPATCGSLTIGYAVGSGNIPERLLVGAMGRVSHPEEQQERERPFQ